MNGRYAQKSSRQRVVVLVGLGGGRFSVSSSTCLRSLFAIPNRQLGPLENLLFDFFLSRESPYFLQDKTVRAC